MRVLVTNVYLGIYLASRRAGLPELSRSLSAKIVRQDLRCHPRFRWLSTAGVCVLGGLHLAAFANACAGSLTLRFRLLSKERCVKSRPLSCETRCDS